MNDDSSMLIILIPIHGGNLRLCLPLATLVDDVLYFHIVETPDCLVAYDLLSRSWLKVVYSSMCDVQFIFEEQDGMLNSQ